MASYVRPFCTAPEPPPLREVFRWVSDHGAVLTLAPESADLNLDDPTWTDAEVLYKPGRQPFITTVECVNGTSDSLFRTRSQSSKSFSRLYFTRGEPA